MLAAVNPEAIGLFGLFATVICLVWNSSVSA